MPTPGPFLAKIVSHLDPTYMGTLEVQLLHEVGNDPAREGQLHQVRYMSPFFGSTSVDFVAKDPDDYNNTQKSYGMWMIPPDVGCTVVVIFIDGDPKKGYWIGCVQDENMNFQVPGYAATKYAVEDSKKTDKERVPVAEYNKLNKDAVMDVTKYEKPATPFEEVLEEQGLLEDDIRGITTSSARREVPSTVFGISTPGPIDKAGKQGNFGKFEHKVIGGLVSRLGGSSFVMDDGDDKFIRKKKPYEGPMEYSAVEQGETDGEPDIPHNELIRLRTRTGHQILLHNSEDLIYIGNARGTSWVQLSSDGKIDVFAEDSISFHTKKDINFKADRDINLEAGRNLNIKVLEEMHTHVIKDQILIVDENQQIRVKKKVDIRYEDEYKHRVEKKVDVIFNDEFKHQVEKKVDVIFNDAYKHKVSKDVDMLYNASYKHQVDSDVDISHGASYKHTVSSSIDIKSGSQFTQEAGSGHDIKAGGEIKQTSGGSNHTSAGGNIIESASQIHMNGPGAATAGSAADAAKPEEPEEPEEAEKAKPLKAHLLPDEEDNDLVASIMRRQPTHEPYPHHENLDPEKYKEDKTDRDIDGRFIDPDEDPASSPSESIRPTAETWKKYSTKTDTFEKIGQGN
jgi:hypothetical protein